jgi:hypothetical protein
MPRANVTGYCHHYVIEIKWLLGGRNRPACAYSRIII